jgi:serine/threonine-protein kinase RsbT
VAVTQEVSVPIRTEVDIVAARQQGRALAAQLGFSSSELALIATAISEVARNIIVYAKEGEIVVSLVESNPAGIMVVVRDQGPGIADIELAMQDGYSTGGGLGLGLPGSKRLMDEFEIQTELGRGTTITMKKWVR